ncbi:MAG: MFS transporter [Streptomyces sp.]|uniref:MFS transporter n=1 Tax=Streptomyces sp. TaxID=1931 RepID=UPI003D6AB840
MVEEAVAAPSPRGSLRPGVILALVCGAQFMVTLDIAIVNVALPSIQADLGLKQADLQWVVITYGLMLGGLLLLGGRAGDLLGRRRVLLAGLGLFTAASLTAGLAESFVQLVLSRGAQGVGAALTAPAALAILAGTFPEGPARNKALGVFGGVGASAASVGVVISGALTAGPGWAWIFYINVPVGLGLVALMVKYIPADERIRRGKFDVGGAVTVTGGLLAVVYAINKSVDYGWTSTTTLGFLAAGLAVIVIFVVIEHRSSAPLMPPRMFRVPTLNAANLVAGLAFAAFFATIFQASLLMQQVLGYSALRTGVAYLSMAVTAVVVSAGPAPRLLVRLGAGWTLVIGQSSSAIGMLLLARVPADAAYWTDLFPGFVLVGVGVGLSVVAAQVAAFIGIDKNVSGLAGGMVETAREIGGALGTAIVASVAIATARQVQGTGMPGPTAFTEGFQRGSLVATGFNVAGALAALIVLRRAERSARARWEAS